MDLRDLFALMRRHKKVLILIVLTAALGGMGYTAKYDPPQNQAILFLTMGMKAQEQALPTTYVTNESHNVIDQFTETVQGWFLDPAFSNRLKERSAHDVQIASRKQEKQNLVMTLTVPANAEAQKSSEHFLALLRERIEAYNQATQTRFVLALSSITPYSTKPHWILNGAVGMMLGFVFGLLVVLMWEYAKGRVTFVAEVEAIAEHPIIKRIKWGVSEEQLLRQLEPILKREEEQMLLIHLIENEKGSHRKSNILNHREGLKELAKRNRPFIAFVELGQTTEEMLNEVRFLSKKPFHCILFD